MKVSVIGLQAICPALPFAPRQFAGPHTLLFLASTSSFFSSPPLLSSFFPLYPTLSTFELKLHPSFLGANHSLLLPFFKQLLLLIEPPRPFFDLSLTLLRLSTLVHQLSNHSANFSTSSIHRSSISN